MQIRVDIPQCTGEEVLNSNSNWMRGVPIPIPAVGLREVKIQFSHSDGF